jgi:serine/threonine-protein kinase
VLRILRQLALALDHLHAQGILHRDLKPANVVIAEQAGDALKLLDLGIAVHEGSAEAQLPQAVFGTPAYMAPEQAAKQRCTRATDLYALGALALELLTGRPPYEPVAPHTLLQALLRDSPGLPSARGLVVSGLDALFERALAREPHARFATACELVDALETVLRPQACEAAQLKAAGSLDGPRAARLPPPARAELG